MGESLTTDTLDAIERALAAAVAVPDEHGTIVAADRRVSDAAIILLNNAAALVSAAREADRLHREREGLWERLEVITDSVRHVVERDSGSRAANDLSVFVAPNAWGVTEWIRRDDSDGERGGGDDGN